MPNHTILPNGVGETLGDSLVVNGPLYEIGGDVWYVSSVLGTDGASPAGKERQQPLATLAQAVTNAAAGDMIVLADDYDETLTAAQTIGTAGLVIVGAGQSAGRPTAKLTNNAGATSLLLITAAGVQLRNILFPVQEQSCVANRVLVTGPNCLVKGCYFECDVKDTLATFLINVGADSCRLDSTTFISTETVRTTPPAAGIEFNATMSDVSIVDCIISGGEIGWELGYAIRTQDNTQTRLLIENINMLLGADIEVEEDSSAIISVGTSTGGARIRIRTSGG